MSKLIISNNKKIVQRVKEHSIENGFEKYTALSYSNCNIVSFKKLNIDNENFVKFENNDFVATAGTLIYKKKIGQNSLIQIYNDFNGNIQKIRKNIIGNYLLCIKKSNKIYIFCEENNLFNVFYTQNDDNWAVSNSLYDLSKNYFGKLSINEFNLIEYIFQSAIIGNGTIFNEVKKLQGDESLCINLETDKLQVFDEELPKTDLKNKDEEFLVTHFVDKLNDITNTIATVFNSHTISMTGGLDARMIFSSMLANNVKPNLVYGVGNTLLTNTKDRDLEINKLYTEKFGLNLHIMNWDTPEKFDKYWETYMNKYGFLSLIYNASNNVFNEFENIKTEFIDFGYFGETLRNRPWLENYNKDTFTTIQYIDDFYIYSPLSLMLKKEKYLLFKEHLISKFNKIAEKNSINKYEISKDEFGILYNDWFKSAHNKICNMNNMHMYATSILSNYELNKMAISIPYYMKKDARFMLKTLHKVYPEVLEVPFFSHTENWIFDEENFKLIKDNRNKYATNRMIQFVKKLISNDKIFQAIKTILLPIYNKGYSKKDIIERQIRFKLSEEISKKIKSNEFNIIAPSSFQGYLPKLAHYSQILEIITEIKKK